MAGGEESEPHTRSNGKEWVFPGALPGQPVEEPPPEEQPESRFVVLQLISVAEAAKVCALLESEGVPCHVGQQPADVADRVELLVHETEADLARKVLARPPESDATEEQEDARELERRYEANWICPKCHRRNLQLLPPPKPWQMLRLGCLVLVTAPFVIAGLIYAVTVRSMQSIVNTVPERLYFAWVITIVILGALTTFAPRRTRCADCDWETGDQAN